MPRFSVCGLPSAVNPQKDRVSALSKKHGVRRGKRLKGSSRGKHTADRQDVCGDGQIVFPRLSMEVSRAGKEKTA